MTNNNPIIQSLWIGKELSFMEQMSINSFLKNGHSYHLYVYQNVKNVPKNVIIKDAEKILPRNRIFTIKKDFGKGSLGAFADIFRYKMLLENGGYWCDLDVISLKPFDFSEKFIFSSEYGEHNEPVFTNTVMKVPAHDKVIISCYEEATKKSFSKFAFGEIGSKLLTKKIKENSLESFVKQPHVFCPIKGCYYKDLINSEFKFDITNDMYAIHLWNEMWRQENSVYNSFINRLLGIPKMDKNKTYTEKTVYGFLQKKYLTI